jgi:hypothetical protein
MDGPSTSCPPLLAAHRTRQGRSRFECENAVPVTSSNRLALLAE